MSDAERAAALLAADAAAGEFEGRAICRECGEDLPPGDADTGVEYHEECTKQR